MSKAGRIVLLTLSLLLWSGAFTQSDAQEKLPTLLLGNATKSNSCSPLSPYLLNQNKDCIPKAIIQKDAALKAELKEEQSPIGITYSVEPTYYVEPPATPLPTITPAAEPLPTTPLQNQTPMDLVPAEGPNLNSDYILELINAHRATIGKPAFQKDDALCSLAQIRSIELHGELFGGTGYLHSGLYNRNLPYWITENAKWGSNEAGTVNWWLNSSVHRRAIEGDYTYSCGSCNGSQCAQLFTSYTPKGGVATTTVSSQ